jgi:hypothetical protein
MVNIGVSFEFVNLVAAEGRAAGCEGSFVFPSAEEPAFATHH